MVDKVQRNDVGADLTLDKQVQGKSKQMAFFVFFCKLSFYFNFYIININLHITVVDEAIPLAAKETSTNSHVELKSVSDELSFAEEAVKQGVLQNNDGEENARRENSIEIETTFTTRKKARDAAIASMEANQLFAGIGKKIFQT